jgi:hypothetical protein
MTTLPFYSHCTYITNPNRLASVFSMVFSRSSLSMCPFVLRPAAIVPTIAIGHAIGGMNWYLLDGLLWLSIAFVFMGPGTAKYVSDEMKRCVVLQVS